MLTEKPMIEAVAAYMDNVPVYAMEKDGAALFPIDKFEMKEIREGGFRYIVDMPELPPDVRKRIEEDRRGKKADGKERTLDKQGKVRKKTLGEQVVELREQGRTNKEIAAMLGKSANYISNLYNREIKRRRFEEPEEDGEGIIRLPSILNDGPDVRNGSCAPRKEIVDLRKTEALLKAGWNIEKIADEFRVHSEDLSEVLKEAGLV